jgi:glycosyltransferase involved in cell wall biosynthesis
MTNTITLAPVGEDAAAYIKREVSEAVSLYALLYPTQTLNFLFYEGKSTVWSAAQSIEGPFTFCPKNTGADFLGQVERPGAYIGAPNVTIMISIPRKPLPNEIKVDEVPWTPTKALQPLYRLSPLFYEKIRYKVEIKRKKTEERQTSGGSLPCGEGSALFPHTKNRAGDKRPAILIGLHWLEIGGAEKLAFDTVEWALEAGLRVFIAASVPSIQRLAGKLPDSPDVTFLRLDRYLPHHLWPRYIESLALAENIQVIHIHHCKPLYESLPQIRANLPWIKVIDSTHIVEYGNEGFPRIAGIWTNFIDVHHVISQQLVGYFRDRFHQIGKVRLGRMLQRTDQKATLPDLNFHTGKKKLQVTFIGRLQYQKRPILMVEAFNALSVWAKKHDVELSGKIVGEGGFLEAVRCLLKRYGLQNAVTLHPANSPVLDILKESDILLLPSNNEGLALVCYEAVEQGCIPISTDVGSQDEIVPADLLVPLEPGGAVKGIVAAVDRLWTDAAFLDRQHEAIIQSWAKLTRDPTAKEVLMPLYRDAAMGAKE